MRRGQLVQRHSHSLLVAHIVWATSQRCPVLGPKADAWLGRLLRQKADEAGCILVACGNGADHVHALVRYPSTVCVATVVQRLKGASSHAWNAAVSVRPDRPRLSWQAGYWAESVSPKDLPTAIGYVEGQRQHHGEPRAPEAWEASCAERRQCGQAPEGR
jgi:putative transposase